MADGITANYSFTQPEVGASADTWGGKLNANWGSLDSILAGIEGDISTVAGNLSQAVTDFQNIVLTAGSGLSGGGDLSQSRTFDVDATIPRIGAAGGQVRINTDLDARYALGVTTITAGTGLTGGGDLFDSRTVNADIATAANFHAGTAGKMIDADSVYAGNAVVSSTGDGDFTPNFNAGRNFKRVLSGESTLQNPTNQRAGQSGLIVIQQNAIGGHDLSFGADWKFPIGTPEPSKSPTNTTAYSYFVVEPGFIIVTQVSDIV